MQAAGTPLFLDHSQSQQLKRQKLMTRNNVNPIKKFVDEFYKHRSGISGFASEINVGYQTIHKAVLGLHSHIPPRIVSHMASVSNIPVEEWQAEYSIWVNKELDILLLDIRNGKIEAEAFFVPASNLANKYADFTEWRSSLSYSQIDFCKTFLLHQAIINRYETGLMKNLPESLISRVTFILEGLFGGSNGSLLSTDSVAAYIKALESLPIKKKN